MRFFVSFAFVTFFWSSVCAVKWNTMDGLPSKLAGHRGEKVFVPEHTLASYEIGMVEQADYVEPDLVLTEDRQFVCYHDLVLKTYTDVSNKPEFADRMRSETIIDPGNWTDEITNDWFIEDFTVEELQTLRIKQRNVGIRPQLFNGLFRIPTFEEYLDTVADMALKQNHPIGIIPELKYPSRHNHFTQPNFMEDELLRILRNKGYPIQAGDVENCIAPNSGNPKKVSCGNVIIQSFEAPSLQYLRTKTNRDLMMLVDKDFMQYTKRGMDDVKEFAQYFSIEKENLVSGPEAKARYNNQPIDMDEIVRKGGFILPKEFVKEAHERGMKMGLYTIYDSHEKSNRGCAIECKPENKTEELFYFFEMGVDSIFVENVQEARELRLRFDYELQLAELRNSTSDAYSISIISKVQFISFAVLVLVLNSVY